MAVMKMTSVTISGAIYDFESIVEKYVIGKEIHLENALTALGASGKKLLPFNEDNQYAQIAKSILEIFSYTNFEPKSTGSGYEGTPKETMLQYIKNINTKIEEGRTKVADMQAEIEHNNALIKQLEMFIESDIELDRLFSLEFMTTRFGSIPKESYKTLKVYLENLDAVFIPTFETNTHIWGMYFMPACVKEQVDATFASLYFERTRLPATIKGKPQAAIKDLEEENIRIGENIKNIKTDISKLIQNNYYRLSDYYNVSVKYADYANIRKKAAHTSEFFFLVGWMEEKDAKALSKAIQADKDTTVQIISEKPKDKKVKPPTKLKNPSILRPFEFFVKMYGMPSYGELDPTPIVALSYFLLFGIMFGDVGQSLLFVIGGFLIYRKTKMDLAAIVSMVGISGMIFGFIYGSVFGNETLLAGIRLIEPMEKISFMLGGAIAIGVCVILICMIINMRNAIRQKNWGKLIFSQNGIAGLVFYASLLTLVASAFLLENSPVNKNLLIALLVVTFIMMFMQEPLSKLVKKKKDWAPKEGMFFVESFFEMFDVLLSFVTNTISFMRVGAFAIIHVGMMMVVGVLANKSAGAGNIITMIIGNIIVMGLEGLIVGIQVLRLEYYEMFSRYYDGSGYEFKTLSKNKVD